MHRTDSETTDRTLARLVRAPDRQRPMTSSPPEPPPDQQQSRMSNFQYQPSTIAHHRYRAAVDGPPSQAAGSGRPGAA